MSGECVTDTCNETVLYGHVFSFCFVLGGMTRNFEMLRYITVCIVNKAFCALQLKRFVFNFFVKFNFCQYLSEVHEVTKYSTF